METVEMNIAHGQIGINGRLYLTVVSARPEMEFVSASCMLLNTVGAGWILPGT